MNMQYIANNYYPLIKKQVAKYIYDHHLKEDIVQEVMLSLITKLHYFNEDKGSVEQFIKMHVKNIVFNYVRGSKNNLLHKSRNDKTYYKLYNLLKSYHSSQITHSTLAKISQDLKLPIKDVVDYNNSINGVVHLCDYTNSGQARIEFQSTLDGLMNNPEVHAQNEELRDILFRAIDLLPPEQKEFLLVSKFDSKISNKQTKQFTTPIKTIYNNLRKNLKSFKDFI